MQLALIIAGSVLAGVVVILLVLRLVLGSFRKKLLQRIRQQFAGKRILKSDLNTVFLGQLSSGLAQIRGNGALILTKDQLCFLLAVPARDICIPLRKIKKISRQKSFLSKTIGKDLIVVEFESEKLADDQVAFAVKDLEEWEAGIKDFALAELIG